MVCEINAQFLFVKKDCNGKKAHAILWLLETKTASTCGLMPYWMDGVHDHVTVVVAAYSHQNFSLFCNTLLKACMWRVCLEMSSRTTLISLNSSAAALWMALGFR